MKYRIPAVAGTFYPDTAVQASAALNGLFADLDFPSKPAKALIVPHAGWIYSGKVAAQAYRVLKARKAQIKRVVLLGPSHRCQLKGCAVPSNDIFLTPLGEIPVDMQSCEQLRRLGLAEQSDLPHNQEHALEVQLPFLQYCLDQFQLVPLSVGQCPPEQIADILAHFAQANDTLIIISTDLSHFLPYQQAFDTDAKTIERILHCDDQLSPHDACGCHALNGLMHFSKQQGWQPELMAKANSGDINHSKDEVVGYASFIVN